MKMIVRLCVLVLVFGLNLPACHSDDGGPAARKDSLNKGGNKTMKTYYMGRFALDVPVEMKQAVQSHTFRLLDIEEGHWDKSGGDVPRKRHEEWHEHLKKVESLERPKGVRKIIIKEEQLEGFGVWAKGVLYYGDSMANDEGTWDILVDYGDTYSFFKLEGLLKAQDKMFDWMKTVINGYKPKSEKPTDVATFYTKLGEIKLPYRRQEKTYSRFERQSPDLKLEIEMNETHKVEQVSMAERLAAAISTRFAPGVDVDRIRSRRRTVGGLKGEELVIRMTASGEDSQVQFGWEYLGEAESGEHPEIQITMESPDSDVAENLKIWDAILDSFKPMYH